MPPFDPVHSPRTTVRPLALDDLDDLFPINGDDTVTQFLPYSSWRTPADAESWYGRMLALGEAGVGRQLVTESQAAVRVP